MLPTYAQETEEWFDDAQHNLCTFKQILNCMKDPVKKRKAVLSSRHSAVSADLTRSESGRSSTKQYLAKSGRAL